MFSYVPAHKSDADKHFHVDGSDVTITVYCTCAQEFAKEEPDIGIHTLPNTEDSPPEPIQINLFRENLTVSAEAGCYVPYDHPRKVRKVMAACDDMRKLVRMLHQGLAAYFFNSNLANLVICWVFI